MEVIRNINELKIIEKSRPIALIPTMGNLHEGHLSLVKQSKDLKLSSVVSIFVNPLQFGPKEDFSEYPRTVDTDIDKLLKEKCDFLFLPDKEELLKGIKKIKAPLSNHLCGKNRPGHFDGVITIVNRFLEIIKPEFCFFGQKDFQQQLIIKQHLKKCNFSTKLILGPTIRDSHGLALSSRNNYLTNSQRKEAAQIFKFLNELSNLLKKEEPKNNQEVFFIVSKLCKEFKEKLEQRKFKVDYLEILNAKNLKELKKGDLDLLIAVAVIFKGVRLIDNLNIDLSFS